MSRKSLENFAFTVSMVLLLASPAKSVACFATYFPSNLFSGKSAGITKNQAVDTLSNTLGVQIKDIAGGFLKDFLSIRAQTAKLGCSAVFILQKSNDIDSSLISAAFISTDDGRTVSESAFPSTQWKDEFTSWVSSIAINQKNRPVNFATTKLVDELSNLGRCEDLHRFLAEDVADTYCQAGGSNIKVTPLKDPFKLVIGGAPFSVKKAWIESLENSKLYDEGRKILTKTAEVKVTCEEDCKKGTLTLTIFVTKDFLANESNPLIPLTSLISDLMEVRNVVAKTTKTTPPPIEMILINNSGLEMKIEVAGTTQNAKLYPSQSIKSFIQKS